MIAGVSAMADEPKEPEHPGLVVIRAFGDEIEANIAKSMLDSAGIESMFSRDNCGGLEPQLSLMQGIKLVVRKEDAEQAEAILAGESEGASLPPA
jgi:Putative prokaryotic signal transducing protein